MGGWFKQTLAVVSQMIQVHADTIRILAECLRMHSTIGGQ